MKTREIITVGLAPVWDRVCYVEGVEWGDHTRMTSTTLTAAGKALNISRALAWMGIGSTAAGLWGRADWADMTEALASEVLIRPAFTQAAGRTRENVTIADKQRGREMHLRSPEALITREALGPLRQDLGKLVDSRAFVVFAGSLPEGDLLDACIDLIAETSKRCGELAVDTSGEALRRIVERGGIGVIKPNLEELSQVLGKELPSDAGTVAAAARGLCGRAREVVVSMGGQGAIAVTKEEAVMCRAAGPERPVVHTVGCGDYLLAGYLAAGPEAGPADKLAAGVKAATAKAWGWAGAKPWTEVKEVVKTVVKKI